MMPRYHDTLGGLDRHPPVVPPLNFRHVSVRIFPLRANVSVLRRFCRLYLDIAPASVARFRPALPYVILAFLDYGPMAGDEANLGWISQREVTFSIPLEWHRRRRGASELVGRIWANPFIFMDDPMSMMLGREVYGWSKVMASFEPDLAPWISDPSAPQRLLTLSIETESKQPGDDRRRKRPLLEIEHHLAQSAALFPLDLRIFDPLANVSRMVRTFQSLAADLLLPLSALPFFGYEARDPAASLRLLSGGLEAARELVRDPGYPILTLKQFRDAGLPETVCYQALVSSRIRVNRYNRGGMLGNFNLLQGDFTGGFRIRVHRHLAHPLVEELGLEVAERVELGGRSFAVLEPVLPYWADLDLGYSRGEVLCWRTRESQWHVGRTPLPGTGPDPVTRPHGHLFSTFATGALQARPGPFHYTDTVFYVFPLLAWKDRLAQLVEGYLPADEGYALRLWGEHVYLVASGGEAASEAGSFAWFGAAEVDFFVPVRCYDRSGRLLGVALIEPFAFIDDVALALTAREVLGEPAVEAGVESPPESWLSGRDRRLLQVKTNVFPALGEGLRSERRVLLEIVQGDLFPSAEDPRWEGIAARWCGALHDDLRAKLQAGKAAWFASLLSFGRELMKGERSLHVLTFKQFRDASEPRFACYQALIRNEWRPRDVHAGREIERLVHVRLHRYPDFPISDALGLKVKLRRARPDTADEAWEGAIVEHLQPVRPFSFRAGLRTEARELSREAGGLDWNRILEEPVPFGRGCLSDEMLDRVAPQALIESLFADGKPCIRADSAGNAGAKWLDEQGLQRKAFPVQGFDVFYQE